MDLRRRPAGLTPSTTLYHLSTMAHSNTTSDDLDPSIQQLLAGYVQQEQARIDQAKARLRGEILPVLAQHRVANIEAAYSGYGDSGAIDGIQFRDSDGHRVERTSLPSDVIEKLENCVYEFLPAGFEINDGGQGSVLIDTQTARVMLKHQENYPETRDSTREFNL